MGEVGGRVGVGEDQRRGNATQWRGRGGGEFIDSPPPGPTTGFGQILWLDCWAKPGPGKGSILLPISFGQGGRGRDREIKFE